jgi:deoxyhypusine synthase
MRDPHERKLGDGAEHGMKPVSFPNPKEIHGFRDLAKAMGETTAGARDLGKAVEVVKAMMDDKDCRVVLTLSGNATPFTTLIAELIDRGIVHMVVSTGSVVTHSFSVERGRPMFQIEDPDATDDNWFYNRGYNRIYDVVELEKSLNEGFDILSEITSGIHPGEKVTSADITARIGNYLNQHFPEVNGLLHAAARKDVPIFIPSFSDCEIGLDFHVQNVLRRGKGKPEIYYDAFGDWESYSDLIRKAKNCGIITLGGGVPRNWAQQVGPYFDILTEYRAAPKSLLMRFRYAVRICTAPSAEGGLSGCTYSEGRSWGKFWPESEGGMNAEIMGDYSLVFPLLCQAIFEEQDGGDGEDGGQRTARRSA